MFHVFFVENVPKNPKTTASVFEISVYLPLNPTKISGICGRLMCCLSYEHKIYKALRKKLPHEGQVINTPKGKARV